MRHHGEYLPESYYDLEVCEANGCDETANLRWNDKEDLLCPYHYEVFDLTMFEEVQDDAA